MEAFIIKYRQTPITRGNVAGGSSKSSGRQAFYPLHTYTEKTTNKTIPMTLGILFPFLRPRKHSMVLFVVTLYIYGPSSYGRHYLCILLSSDNWLNPGKCFVTMIPLSDKGLAEQNMIQLQFSHCIILVDHVSID